MFKNIGIFVKKKTGQGFANESLDDMVFALSKNDIELYIDESSSYKNQLVKAVTNEQFIENVDLIIVFGGDGTLLNSARQYLEYEIPILGVNMGNVGFLTDLKIDNFDATVKDILMGNFKIEERNLVSARFNEEHLYGLNEVVIHSGAYAQLMRYRLNVNEKVVYEQRSDGLIIATPTGSTAYSLSAGGPIIHPSLDVWTILPMLPQSLSSRPFIISSDENVEVELLLDSVINSIKTSLSKGEEIEMRGFGSFFVKKRKARDARNPLTNKTIRLQERYVPTFKVSKILKEYVNKTIIRGF